GHHRHVDRDGAVQPTIGAAPKSDPRIGSERAGDRQFRGRGVPGGDPADGRRDPRSCRGLAADVGIAAAIWRPDKRAPRAKRRRGGLQTSYRGLYLIGAALRPGSDRGDGYGYWLATG